MRDALGPNRTVTLRPFGRGDFERLISWAPSEAALADWCGGFFRHPLDAAQLGRYLDSAQDGNSRLIFTACADSGEPVGHVEISQIWPHLSSRLSRVLVAPSHRRRGIGTTMVGLAVSLSFDRHHVDRVDLGVSTGNVAAISCYRGLGFEAVGIWRKAFVAGGRDMDVQWMTLRRAAWSTRMALAHV
ncbi:MAG TPA: GNAT family protein [Vineibacter sp.]|nr:GNAT family protein [Vineibacter sp.]